jgi:hypothetical protein
MKGRGINDAEASLKAFLRQHSAMDPTIGTLSRH